MKDREILRPLAEKYAELSLNPLNEQRREGWRRVNDLEKSVRPMVWVNELPWEEIDFDGSLTLRCEDAYLREIECFLRQTIFQWKHFQGDMIVDPWIDVMVKTNFDPHCGVQIVEDVIAHDERGGIVSHNYKTQFENLDDLDKIKFITIEYDEKETVRRHSLVQSLIGDLIEVRVAKFGFIHFTPWDKIAMWYHPMDILTDLILKPELMHGIVGRVTDSMIDQLKQLDKLNLLERCDNNQRIGSGGLGYVSDLPGEEYKPDHVHPHNQWGNAMPQIFSEVSPDMHEEFALQYDRKWLNLFGLSYYGCCEPLHNKLGILKSVKNLRKISMSPWADLDKAVEETNGKYVLSVKPSPAFLAEDRWNPDAVRASLRELLKSTSGLPSEFILKDISTCRGDVSRITEWCQIAKELIEE